MRRVEIKLKIKYSVAHKV